MGIIIIWYKKTIIRGLPFIFRDLASQVLQSASSIVKLDIFEVIRTQNFLTFEHYLCCLQ